MGYGSYRAADWAKLRGSRKLDTASTNEIFSKTKMDPRFDPKFINVRESKDSEEHPNSTPIMIGVDVTGSMGYLSTQIVKESLNELMQQLYSTDMIPDPQLLFAAIGDASYDAAPLQVTQFESDIRIAEQLMDLWLEGGGGDCPEDFELLWYFAAKHTAIDSFEKRGKKGFCITIGDAPTHDKLSHADVLRIFGDKTSGLVKKDYSSAGLAKLAGEKYELLHVMIDGDKAEFASLIPGRVICVSKQDIKYLPEILISAMQICLGKNKENVLLQWGELSREVVNHAISQLCISNGKSISF